jgi:hypothetical protein
MFKKHVHWCLGASLLECLLALSLMALLFMGAQSRFQRLTKRRALARETAELEDVINNLSERALQLERTLELDLWEQEYTARDEARGTLLHRHRLPPSVILADLPTSPFRVFFYPSGAATPTALWLRKEPYSCSLILSLRGRARTECFG